MGMMEPEDDEDSSLFTPVEEEGEGEAEAVEEEEEEEASSLPPELDHWAPVEDRGRGVDAVLEPLTPLEPTPGSTLLALLDQSKLALLLS